MKLEHELEIIRLSGHLKEVPLQERLATLEKIYEQTKQYSVHELCDALEVARGTFYNHIFRRADRTKYHEEQASLTVTYPSNQSLKTSQYAGYNMSNSYTTKIPLI